MGSAAGKSSGGEMAELYDRDFVLWTEEMARLLRERRFGELDIENLAEEVERMGKRDRRELLSRLEALLMHLVKRQIHRTVEGVSGNPRSTCSVAGYVWFWRIRPASAEHYQGIFTRLREREAERILRNGIAAGVAEDLSVHNRTDPRCRVSAGIAHCSR